KSSRPRVDGEGMPGAGRGEGEQVGANGVVSLGFLTVLREGGGYLGGYLVTNGWGRPLEFRLTSAVQPNRVQQVRYGRTLPAYVCADLIGKALVERAGTPVRLVVTDTEEALDLRWKVDVPVMYLAPSDGRAPADPAALVCHARFPGDAGAARDLLAGLDSTLDLAEPFARIREAVAEARRMGVTRAPEVGQPFQADRGRARSGWKA